MESINSDEIMLADSTQIHQIIMNLCTNAYHAMQKTGGKLKVSLQDIEITEENAISGLDISPGKYIRFEVSDTGHGMDEETKEKIFEPYFTTKKIGEGTGLGLAVVHGILSAYNGHILVESEPQKGTDVIIFFPVFEGVSAELEKSDNEPVKFGCEKIMFVDDEKKICQIVKETLTKYGYQVTVFHNAYQAVLEFEKEPDQFELIITDVAMPKMNGIELAQDILKRSPQIPVILCSGHSDLVNEKLLDSMGVKFLQKPIVMNELVRTVRKIFDSGKKICD